MRLTNSIFNGRASTRVGSQRDDGYDFSVPTVLASVKVFIYFSFYFFFIIVPLTQVTEKYGCLLEITNDNSTFKTNITTMVRNNYFMANVTLIYLALVYFQLQTCV